VSDPFLPSTWPARRRPWRRTALAALLALAAAGGIAAAALVGGGHRAAHSSHLARRAARATAPAPPAVSPAGLPLAPTAFPLTGLVHDPSAYPVRVGFRAPPRAGLLFDVRSGRVLWARDPHRRLPIASLTKMMTALVAVRATPPDAPVLITRQAVAEGGSKVGLLPLGRHVRFESLLYGLLLPSGNDAAVAIAQHVAGTIPAFVAKMNAQAAALGMACSRFSSPSGFYDAGNFSCAADLALLAHFDLAQPRVARVVRTFSAVIPFPIKGGKLYLYNNNPLLVYGYPGASGIKTGYTEASGRCLVATAERDGVSVGVVLLDSKSPGTQARRLLDAAFDDVYHLPRVHEPPMPLGA
jgi:D-alanyl-D-alanine carboxypeptidase (penicillin-binding protein 5/6)